MDDDQFDNPLGQSSGAADIFGVTGGVLEAACRSVYYMLNGKNLEGDAINFRAVRGLDGIKEATVQIAPGKSINVAVCSGLGNARKVLDMVRQDPNRFQAIEIMACPGGCINGGGQPVQPASVRNFVDLKSLRASALYKNDENRPLRKSHLNEDVKTVYAEYLGEPNSHKAHELLHTSYVARPMFDR